MSDYLVAYPPRKQKLHFAPSARFRDDTWTPSYILKLQKNDDQGVYTQYRQVHLPQIDASFLRAGREILSLGIQTLYGRNKFLFMMNTPTMNGSPPSMIRRGQEWTRYRPKPRKPFDDEDGAYGKAIQQAISEIERQVPRTQLRGWAYYDQFLRFIYEIGPGNAALLEHVTFDGTVIERDVPDDDDPPPPGLLEDDLVDSLRLYMPFILRFCTNLKHLVIYARPARYSEAWIEGEGRAAIFESKLRPVLEKEVIKIGTLQTLKVYSYLPDAETEAFHTVNFAVPTIKLIHDRYVERKNAATKKPCPSDEVAEMDDGNVLKCEFCAEDHVWAECYNLCGFCGAYGHFHWKCRERKRAWTVWNREESGKAM